MALKQRILAQPSFFENDRPRYRKSNASAPFTKQVVPNGPLGQLDHSMKKIVKSGTTLINFPTREQHPEEESNKKSYPEH